MYYATGLPGWMRFGFSPGWIGRSPTGLGPCASYFMTGQWPTPQAQAYWQVRGAIPRIGAVQSGQAAYPQYGGGWASPPPFAPGTTEEQELAWLKSQADMLSQQLEQINSRISELEKASK
jgi:hypothetical protein